MNQAPFFIVGFQRSGTTLLRMMLNAHPRVAIPLDTVGLWASYENKLPGYGDLSDEENRRRLVTDLIREDRIQLWETPMNPVAILDQWKGREFPQLIGVFYQMYAAAKGKSLWGDKDPGNMLRIPRLAAWFPASRFVHIIRDGRDACLSQLEQDFGFNDLLPCAEAWREQVWWVRNIGSILGPERYFELRYEDLVTSPEPLLRKVAAFLGLDYSDRMLRYYEEVDDSVPASKRHLWPLLREPPQTKHVGNWKRLMSSGQQLCFEKRARDVLRDLDYDTLAGEPSGAYFEELKSIARRIREAVKGRLRASR